jgi:PncC family amidohydrolase
MYLICKDLVDVLKEKNLTLSCAESCTGGLVAKMITDVGGASNVFFGGVVSYTNEIKERVLGVKHETLEKYTAYSYNTADEMAEGVRRLYKTDIGISTTGVAGPGPDGEVPAGTVYLGISYKDKTESIKVQTDESFSREEIRECAAFDLIDILIKKIKEKY